MTAQDESYAWMGTVNVERSDQNSQSVNCSGDMVMEVRWFQGGISTMTNDVCRYPGAGTASIVNLGDGLGTRQQSWGDCVSDDERVSCSISECRDEEYLYFEGNPHVNHCSAELELHRDGRIMITERMFESDPNTYQNYWHSWRIEGQLEETTFIHRPLLDSGIFVRN